MRSDDVAKCVDDLGGIATAAQLKDAGFGLGVIDYAYKRGAIGHLTCGAYCAPDALDDDFAAVCARWRK